MNPMVGETNENSGASGAKGPAETCLDDLADILKTLTEYYKTDRLNPGIHVSYIQKRSLYYLVVKRYSDNRNPKQERIIANATGATLTECIQSIKEYVSMFFAQDLFTDTTDRMLSQVELAKPTDQKEDS